MERTLTRISVVLAALGLLVAVYMTIFKLTDNQTMCLGNGGCSVVNNSVYSEVYGVPVAVVGALGYSAILRGSCSLRPAGLLCARMSPWSTSVCVWPAFSSLCT